MSLSVLTALTVISLLVTVIIPGFTCAIAYRNKKACRYALNRNARIFNLIAGIVLWLAAVFACVLLQFQVNEVNSGWANAQVAWTVADVFTAIASIILVGCSFMCTFEK